MSVSTALVFAQVSASGGSFAAFMAGPGQLLPLVGVAVAFYILIMRPNQRRAKDHAARIAAVKRGDTVVMSSGMIGKVVRVEETEVGVEIAQNVTVKVVKNMIADVRTRGEPAPANDAKS